ncbi:MIF4G like protein [Cooperia oncophora]
MLIVRKTAQELTNYARGANVPIAYMILEVLFSQLFRLPLPPQPTGFYECSHRLCLKFWLKLLNFLYQRAGTMQPLCLDRLVDWFSFHLSNFGFRWSWNDWKDCLVADRWDAKKIFAREVIEKVPSAVLLRTVERVPSYVVCCHDSPSSRCCVQIRRWYESVASKFHSSALQSRSDDNTIMAEIRDADDRYDPDLFGIFFAVLLKTSAKSFSHTFVALSRYSTTLKTIADTSDEMQEVLLCLLVSVLASQSFANSHIS